MDYKKVSLEAHEKLKGKIEMTNKINPESKEDLSIYYSPGVAEPCREIIDDPDNAYKYTWKGNTVAVVSDGSAVLGLGNIWPLAGLPVMEGKAMLFKRFGGLNAVPIVLKCQDPEDIIAAVEAISPSFGGINLEDIKAPNCFIVEEELKKRLDIPVFHDDQHGTSIVVLAALTNALKVVGKDKSKIKIAMLGAGSAAIAIARLLVERGVKHIVMVDTKGALYQGRTVNMNKYKEDFIFYNLENQRGDIHDVIKGADVFIGVTTGSLLTKDDIKNMADKPIVFAMSNPTPEIMPEEAIEGGAYIVATGRSDYPNQVNNVLIFPGMFKGALEARIKQFNDDHFLAAANALAAYIKEPTPDHIIPSVFEEGIADMIAEAVKKVG